MDKIGRIRILHPLPKRAEDVFLDVEALLAPCGVSCKEGFLYLTENHITVVFRRKTFLRKDCRGLTEYYKM